MFFFLFVYDSLLALSEVESRSNIFLAFLLGVIYFT